MRDKNRRVLHFLKTGEYSGAENVAITIIEELKKYGIEGIYVSIDGPICDILKEKKIAHAMIDDNTVRSYQKVIDEYEPDIIHAHDFGTSFLIAKCKSNAIKISHLHNNPLWLKRVNLKSVAYLLAVNKFDTVVAVSESVFNEYVFNSRIKIKKQIVGNPVNSSKVIEMAQTAKCVEESDIMFLGRFSAPKNPKRFIDIIELVKKQNQSVKALMIGKGELEEECKNLIIDRGLADCICLKGFQKNPYGLLNSTKVLCMPSEWEGYGLAAVEAFSLGVPVIAAPVGGLKDLVTEKSGKLCTTNDQFADEILRLLNNPDYYQEKSYAARERGKELNNLDSYMRTIFEIYSVAEEKH